MNARPYHAITLDPICSNEVAVIFPPAHPPPDVCVCACVPSAIFL